VNRAPAVAACRVFFAGAAVVAIAVQLISLASQGTLNPVNYFSYFTIDRNLIATGVLIAGALLRDRTSTPTLDLVRGGAVVYMSITGIVFTLLLSNTDVDTRAHAPGDARRLADHPAGRAVAAAPGPALAQPPPRAPSAAPG
jgi:hypothetical protein